MRLARPGAAGETRHHLLAAQAILRNCKSPVDNFPERYDSQAARNCTATRISGAFVSDYRVVYIIDDDHKMVSVTRIAHRRDVYKI